MYAARGFNYCEFCGASLAPTVVTPTRERLKRRENEEFIEKLAREIKAVMEREMFTPPDGLTYIPPEYLIYLSPDDDMEWQGGKRRALEQGLFNLLSKYAREFSSVMELATKKFAVELRVNGTLEKGDCVVHAIWDTDEGGHTEVNVREPDESSMHWSAIATHAVFGEKPASQAVEYALPPPPPPPQSAVGDFLMRGATLSQDYRTESDMDALPQPAALSAGREGRGFAPGMKLLGRYRIIKHLGEGGFAKIYLAFDELLDEEIAVKVPDLQEESHPLAQTFKSQLKAWKFLSDKDPSRVVRLLNAEHVQVSDGDTFCIFMEYMSGGSFANMVRSEWDGCPRNPEQLSHLMRLFLQICRAVHFLHAHKALHRDIKPSNMLLDAAHATCKLSDFELIDHRKDGAETQTILGGTPHYMAPECIDNKFSESSDIFALGVTLYQLLSGRLPFQVNDIHDKRRQPPTELTKLNPLIPPELQQVVMRCLELEPQHRPQGVDDLIDDLAYIGISDEEASAAPVNLAHLMLTYLDENEKAYLIKTLTEDQGFRSARKETAQLQTDLIQEYCYTASPREVLANNFTSRQLAMIAGEMGLKSTASKAREELITDILEAIGFLPGPQKIPGIETTRSFLESQLMGLAHTTNSDECSGMALSGLTAIERTVDWLVRFYGQLFYGSGFTAFLSRQANGKPWNRLTFGEKVGALRMLCSKRPPLPLPHRILQVFEWPIIPLKLFDQLDPLVKRRNELAHTMERGNFYDAQRSARQVLSAAVEVVAELTINRYIPRIVQIISRQDDVYGRHFYLGRDDRGHSERIFTPLALSVGRLYLFYPLTNPVRINPLIFPYDTSKQDDAASGTTISSKKKDRKTPDQST